MFWWYSIFLNRLCTTFAWQKHITNKWLKFELCFWSYFSCDRTGQIKWYGFVFFDLESPRSNPSQYLMMSVDVKTSVLLPLHSGFMIFVHEAENKIMIHLEFCLQFFGCACNVLCTHWVVPSGQQNYKITQLCWRSSYFTVISLHTFILTR